MVYSFGGGCNAGYNQGASTGGNGGDTFLSHGYAVASSSLNVFGNKCDEDPRVVAGAPRSEDILKCQLKPIALSDYKARFTPAELARLKSVFPQGVCDWSKKGVNQLPLDGTWLKYGPRPGTWVSLASGRTGAK